MHIKYIVLNAVLFQQEYNVSAVDKHPQMCVEVMHARAHINPGVTYVCVSQVCVLFLHCSFLWMAVIESSVPSSQVRTCYIVAYHWCLPVCLWCSLSLSEGRSEWSVTVVPGSLHLHVHLTSDVTASFAAQLCDRHEDKCLSRGHVVSRQLVSNSFPVLCVSFCSKTLKSCMCMGWPFNISGWPIYQTIFGFFYFFISALTNVS